MCSSTPRPFFFLRTRVKWKRFYYCTKNIDWQLPFDLVEDFYRAYNLFSSYLNDPAYQYRFRLEQGDCVPIPELSGVAQHKRI